MFESCTSDDCSRGKVWSLQTGSRQRPSFIFIIGLALGFTLSILMTSSSHLTPASSPAEDPRRLARFVNSKLSSYYMYTFPNVRVMDIVCNARVICDVTDEAYCCRVAEVLHSASDNDQVASSVHATENNVTSQLKYLKEIILNVRASDDAHRHHDDDSRAKQLHDDVRVLVWVMTHAANLEKKAVHVNKTWGKR